MRTVAIALACIFAGTAIAGATELTPTSDMSPSLTSPTATLRGQQTAQTEVRAYAPDQLQMHHAFGDSGRPPRGRICFNQAETRDKIALHRLADPVQALRLGRLEGEALSAKLCRWKPDEFVYELHVLRRDGRVLHVFMNAQNGEALNGQSASERDKDRN